MKEEWIEFEFKEMQYLISNKGKIKGCAKGNLLKQRYTEDGYLEVTLGKWDKRTSQRIHRLVAKVFVENDDPENKIEVNHKDFNRENNHADNLEWLTHLDNIKYSHERGRYVPRFGSDNPNYGNDTLKKKYAENPELARMNNARPASQNGRAKQLNLYDKNLNFIKTFSYIGECCEYLIENHNFKAKVNAIRSAIGKSIKINRIYKGFYFKLVE